MPPPQPDQKLAPSETTTVSSVTPSNSGPPGPSTPTYETPRVNEPRTVAEAPIDAKTVLPNGRPVDGPAELRQELFRSAEQFPLALTEKLMMYALGRELEYFDMPQVRAVVRAAKERDYRFSALVAGIVQSDAFRMQAVRREGESSDSSSAQASLDAAGR